MTFLRSIVVIMCAFLWALLLMPVQGLVLLIAPKNSYVLPQLFHKGICRLLRVQVIIQGTPSPEKPTLFVLNHISWLDIPVVGKALKGCFVARQEVRDSPFFGPFFKLQRTIFISQTPSAVKIHKEDMLDHLDGGENIFLFPEGTSSNGIIVQNFKSAYFVLAETHEGTEPLTVQPVTLAYSQMDNLMMTRGTMGVVAWVGNESLLGHIWAFLNSGRITAELRFHTPVTINEYDSRKSMATDCQLVITKGLSRALTGRSEPK